MDEIYFESFGVKIGLEAEKNIEIAEFLETFKPGLRNNFAPIEREKAEHLFRLKKRKKDGCLELFKDGKSYHISNTRELIFSHLDTQLRVTIAENAVEKVFLHAGVVAWKKKAIIIPGKSFQGKTTLVAALVKRGAEYFSDEYAVLDEKGFVHPFPKMLSLRGVVDNFRQIDVAVETIGGRAAAKPLEVGMILFTEYTPKGEWKPEELSMGKGIMELLPHTIPIRINPEFTLNVLNKIVNRAIISKTLRGEADVFAEIIIKYFETRAF